MDHRRPCLVGPYSIKDAQCTSIKAVHQDGDGWTPSIARTICVAIATRPLVAMPLLPAMKAPG